METTEFTADEIEAGLLAVKANAEREPIENDGSEEGS